MNVAYLVDWSLNLTVSLPLFFLSRRLTTVPGEKWSSCHASTWSPQSRRWWGVKAPNITVDDTVDFEQSVHFTVYSRPLPTRAVTSPTRRRRRQINQSINQFMKLVIGVARSQRLEGKVDEVWGTEAPRRRKHDIALNFALRITLVNAHCPCYCSYHHVCKWAPAKNQFDAL